MPARLGLPLVTIIALALSACAQTPPGLDVSQPKPFDVATPTTEAESAAAQAAQEAQSQALSESSSLTDGTSEVVLMMRGGRVEDDGTDELRIARDSLERVRSVTMTSITPPSDTSAGARTNVVYYFDGTGRSVGLGHLIQIDLHSSCRRPTANWYVDVLLDGPNVVSVRQRLPATNGPGETDCAPPRPAGLTVPVYATASALLDAVGVADLDALEWRGQQVLPPMRVPPPPRRN